MKRLFLPLFLILGLALFVLPARAASPIDTGEYIILVGGPSLKQWEKYKARPHDHWWANFVRAGRIRTEQLRALHGDRLKITWLVYKKGYVERAAQENQDLVSHIESVRDKYGLNLVWFDKGREVINYLNAGQPRDRMKVLGFEFFGHSNKACFMFDYSNATDSASKSWLHESQLTQINRRIFARDAHVKSWGCHTGESMSKKWKTATGTTMWGAVGKTQYMMEELPFLSSTNGRWAR